MAQQQKEKILIAADYLVRKSQEEPEKGLDPLKLQKLLYYSKAWGLVLKDKEIFPEDFQAWVHGPANPVVWQAFREFNFKDEHPEYLNIDFSSSLDEDEMAVLDAVWRVYGKFDGKYLEALTHSEKPWIEARQGLNDADPSQQVIPSTSLKEYYGQRFADATA